MPGRLLKQITINGSTISGAHQTVGADYDKTLGNMKICAVGEQNPPLIPCVAASKSSADTYSLSKSKMFLQRCWFKSVCRAPDKTQLVASPRRAGTVTAPVYYFILS